MDLKKILLTVLIASLSFSGIVGILIFLFSKFGTLEARVLLTTISIGGFSMAGLCSSLLFEKQKCVPFAITGMSIDFIGFLVVLASFITYRCVLCFGSFFITASNSTEIKFSHDFTYHNISFYLNCCTDDPGIDIKHQFWRHLCI